MRTYHDLPILTLGLICAGTLAAEENAPSFCADVAPILQTNCVACHNAKKAEGGYRIDTFTELSKPGDSGETPLIAGDDMAGELLRRLTSEDESERMPAETDALAADQIQIVKGWIAGGAKFDGTDPDQQLAFVIPAAVYPDPPQNYPTPTPITAVAFTPDSDLIVAAGYHELTVWNIDGTLVRRISNVGQRTYAIEFSPDNQTLVVGCGEPGVSGEVRLIDFESGDVRGVAARTNDVVLDVAFHPRQPELAVASADNRIRIVDSATLEEKRTIASHADWVTSVSFNQDGSRMVSASRDKSCKLYDTETGQLLVGYAGHKAAVRSVGFLPDGKAVVSVGDNHKLHRWEIEKGQKKAEIPLGGSGYRLSIGPNNLYVPVSDGRVLRINHTDNKVAAEFKGQTDWVLSSAIDQTHQKIAAGGHDGRICVWNLDGNLLGSWLAKP